MKIPPLGSAVRIDWIDTTSVEGWRYLRPGDRVDTSPRKMTTAGILVGEGPTAITLTTTLSKRDAGDATEGHLGWLIIPRGCITKIEVSK